jgi:tetratricopeptide (TPR) repeat protein
VPEAFVGRARDLRRVDAALHDSAAGRGGVMVVSGAAGIGKTHFCRQVLARARRAGHRTARGSAWTEGGAPPFWPWISVLTELCGQDAGKRLELTDPASERFSRFVATGEELARACEAAPVCIVIDDVHAADPDTLLLSRYVAKLVDRIPALLIVIRRDEPEVAPDVERLLVDLESEATLIVLPPFDWHETAAFLAAHGVSKAHTDLLATVLRVTGGLPLFLRRLVALGPPDAESLPGGLCAAIGEAVRRLPPYARHILAVSALLGSRPAVSEVAVVAQCTVPAVVDAARRGARVGLIDRVGADGYSFTHDLVRDVLARAVAPAERLDTHARAAAMLDDRPAVTGADPLTRRARHAVEAATRSPADAAIAVAACRTAAEALVRSFAYEQATSLLHTATSVHQLAGLGDLPADLLVERAEAVLLSGRLSEARSLFGDAAALAERQRNPVVAAAAALGLGGVWVNEHRSPVDRARVLGLQRRALAELPPEQTALRCRLTTRLAAEDVYDGGPVTAVLEALDAARRCGDPHALAESLSLTHHALLDAEHTGMRLGLAEELITVASTAGEGVLALLGLCFRAVDLFHLGDARATRALADLRAQADAVGCRSILYIVGTLDVMLLIRAGRLTEAEALAEQVLELGTDVGDADALAYFAGQLLSIRWLQGREVELLQLAEDMITSPTLARSEFGFHAAAAYLMARAGQTEKARAALDQLVAGGLGALPRSSTWLTGMFAIAECAVITGDAALARDAYAQLRPFAPLPVMPSLAVTCFGSVERSLGLAASAAGDADGAVQHLERALVANRRLGHRPLVIIGGAELADALWHRAGPDDRERACRLLDGAITAARDMGLSERADAWSATKAARQVDTGDVAAKEGLLCREGGHWLTRMGRDQVVMPDLVGMKYLAELLANPLVDVPAARLASGVDQVPEPVHQPVLDRDARLAYRRRAGALAEDIADARARHDVARTEALLLELEEIEATVNRASARAGRPRAFAGPQERARTAVRKAIKRAVDEIGAASPAIGAALRATIVTGSTCSYQPDPAHPVEWRVCT